MKTKLLKLVLCALTLLPLSAWADINFGTEEVVNTTTTWTFNDYSDGDMKSFSVTDRLYTRAVSTRYFTIDATNQELTFSDGHGVTVNKVATSNTAGGVSSSTSVTTANSVSGNDVTAFFAFNASVAGTCYMYIQEAGESHDNDYRQRIYFYDGTGAIVSKNSTKGAGSLGIEEVKWTSDGPGTFIVGATGAACKIYAIRFVPTQYTISYAANGGTGTMSSNTVIKGNNQTLNANAFTKDGYTFANWTADVNVTIGDETVTAGSTIANSATIQNVTSDIALTAQWSANSYTVTLDNQSATSAGTTSVSVTSDANTELTSNITCPTKTGYTFGGYFTETAGGGSQLVDSEGAWIASVEGYTDASTNWIHSDNVTLYAKWTVTVTHTLSSATATRGATGADAATYNTEYSAVFKAKDGYVLPSAITVKIGGVVKTVTTDYTWDQATGKVTILADITGDIDIKVSGTAIPATTIWNFDQYAGKDVAQFGNGSTGVGSYNGLYIHTSGTVTFKDKVGKTKMALYNSNVSDIPTLTNVAEDDATIGITALAYKAPAAGTLTVSFYVANNRDLKIYANGSEAGYVLYNETTAGSATTIVAKNNYTATYTASANDVIYIIPRTGAIYFEEVKFVPTSGVEGAASKTVNISAAGYATFCAPQNYRWSTKDYSKLKAYYVSEVNSTQARLQEIEANKDGYVTIPACTGVILASGETTQQSYILTSTESATAVGTNCLKANIANYVLPADNGTNYNYTLAAGPVFKHSSGSGTLAAGKAFLRTTIGEEARGFNLVFDEDETTAVADVRTKKEDVSGDYYDLSGRKVVQPTRGLYIVNGKKVFIK